MTDVLRSVFQHIFRKKGLSYPLGAVHLYILKVSAFHSAKDLIWLNGYRSFGLFGGYLSTAIRPSSVRR